MVILFFFILVPLVDCLGIAFSLLLNKICLRESSLFKKFELLILGVLASEYNLLIAWLVKLLMLLLKDLSFKREIVFILKLD